MRSFRIGTRKSDLALWQARFVQRLLEEAHPGMEVELVTMDTEGDKRLEVPLSSVAGKGFFTAEIEERLYGGEIDIAVHSLKDLPTVLPEGLGIGAYCERGDARDAFLGKDGRTFDELPAQARVGTSSLRRTAQLRRLRPDVECVEIRGNLGTRWRKLQEADDMDGIVLAAAGVVRLGWQERITQFFDPLTVLSAPGQGVVAVESLTERADVREALAAVNHRPTELAARAERCFLALLGGGCQTPIASFATVEDGAIRLAGSVISLDGTELVHVTETGDDPEQMGERAARRALDAGADAILRATCGAPTDH